MYKCTGVLGLFLALIMAGCASKTQKLEGFVKDFVSLEGQKLNEREPLKDLIPLLERQASRSMLLHKSNMAEAMAEASKSKYAVIISGKHTIAKITDFNDVQRSTSWGTKLPMCEGYIQKKGDFKALHNYLSYIIGKPDGPERTMYLFD